MSCSRSPLRQLTALALGALTLASAALRADHHLRGSGEPLGGPYGPARSADHVRCDVYRKPLETLEFFGLKKDMTVLESWPGGGWYTEILAPYLAEEGLLIGATYNRDPATQLEWQGRYNAAFDAKLAEDPASFGAVQISSLKDGTSTIAEAGSVDLILDFRNAHNWLRQGARCPRPGSRR